MKPQNTIEKLALIISVIYGAVTFGGAIVILSTL